MRIRFASVVMLPIVFVIVLLFSSNALEGAGFSNPSSLQPKFQMANNSRTFNYISTGDKGTNKGSNIDTRDGDGNSWSISSVPGGWKVSVTYHVKSLTLPGSIAVGVGGAGSGVSNVAVHYDVPYIIRTYFTVDNNECGGNFHQDPPPALLGQGHWDYPNSGHATAIIAIPQTDNPNYQHEIQQVPVDSGRGCGDPGPTSLQSVSIIDPEAIEGAVQKIVALIPVPQLTVKANPGKGLVTIPAWFWLVRQENGQWWQGTDPAQGGQPFGVNLNISSPDPTVIQEPSPLDVQVLIDVQQLVWNFDDNSSSHVLVTADEVGIPYPRESNVRHPYNRATTFHPSVTINYVPRYSVNGGAFVILPDLARQSNWQMSYTVREAQTIIVNPDDN